MTKNDSWDVELTAVERKKVYEYRDIVITGIPEGWHIHYEWRAGANVHLSRGTLTATLRRKIEE